MISFSLILFPRYLRISFIAQTVKNQPAMQETWNWTRVCYTAGGFFTSWAATLLYLIICLFPIPKKGNAKECLNYCTISLISHASKVMIKILQARLQQYVNRELPAVQAGFRKDRGTRDQIANIRWITEKAREFQKNINFCFIDYAKAYDCVDHNKLWKILKDMEIPDQPDLPLEKPICRSGSNC